MSQSNLPVILLASGQDQASAQGDLPYNLKLEMQGMRNALAEAERAGLCQVIAETNLGLTFLIDQFAAHSHQLAVLFLGGTHDDFGQLLAAHASGKPSDGAADGDLYQWLGKQRGLQLVFLNGCGQESYAQQLIEAGVPVVISSTVPVVDAMAKELSVRFFKGLAQGASLRRAWEEAADQVRIFKGEEATTSYQVLAGADPGKVQSQVAFPWKLYVKKGAELVPDWNLPVASQNPLLKLPLPKKWLDQLPDRPFRGLHYFERADAGVFFGRGKQIWSLYQRLEGTAPIVLYYGKSGSGKSSLLDAGLLPRIEGDFVQVYQRRVQALGLEGSLMQALLHKAGELGVEVDSATAWWQQRQQMRSLNQAVYHSDERLRARLRQDLNEWNSEVRGPSELRKLWLAIEDHTQLPLLLILDQVEEVFTRPTPPEAGIELELEALLAALMPIFGPSAVRPQGKLLLSYRKEYHPEIRRACFDWKLPCTELFLQHLDRTGIIEAVEGVAQQAATQQKYGLTLAQGEDGRLGEIVADDLLADPQAPVAAVLQIVLTKMWNQAYAANPQAPVFSIAQYQAIKREGLAMGEFFAQQLQSLRLWQQEVKQDVVDSGLVLDVLYFHTTAQGTSGTRRMEELRQAYQHRDGVINELVAKCKELYLLTEAQHSATETSLAHDTLAPVVQRTFNESDTPGQRAARILAGKLPEFEASGTGVYLDEADLRVVEQGLQGMKRLQSKAEGLMAWSQQLRAKRDKARKRNRWLLMGLGIGILLFGVGAMVNWVRADQAHDNTIEQQIRASWRAGVFLREAEVAYESSDSWLEGLRSMEEHLRPIIDLDKLNTLAADSVFLSGPHQGKPNYAATDFARYNPRFLTWAIEHGIPAAEDEAFRSLTQPIYDEFLREIARAYYLIHAYVTQLPPERIEQIKQSYLQEIEQWQGQPYEKDFATGPGHYIQYEVPEFDSNTNFISTLDLPSNSLLVYNANVACGFWIRRDIDGTQEAFYELLQKLLETYDPEYLAEIDQR
jgi:hypothetical protein